jgi:integrase-like protein
VTGTALDESNVRKALNRILDAAEVDRRGPHQMRHTFASLMLAAGAPITYVSRQLGHKDASITLRVYAHWLPSESGNKLVDLLDVAHPSASQAHPGGQDDADQKTLSALDLDRVVSREGIEHVRRGGRPTPTCLRITRRNHAERSEVW